MKFTKASLIADALSLGPHWIYNQNKVARLYPDGISTYTNPGSAYHPNRKAGQFTHYGDQTQVLQEVIQAEGKFDPESWKTKWLAFMATYDGYIDGASKETLESEGTRLSSSNDLAGASRIGPILDLGLSLDDAIKAAREQTLLTHGVPNVADSAEFFVRAVYALQAGASMESAFEQAADEGQYVDLNPGKSLQKAKDLLAEDFRKVGTEFGLTCHVPEAFPLTLYFALRPNANFATAISDNGLAGGDTSARAMVLGVLFAALDDPSIETFPEPGKSDEVTVEPGSNDVQIDIGESHLAGVLEMPESGSPKAFALFAHCFTCGKDFVPEKRITQGLAKEGIATLRIDFSGLGASGGAFKDSSFVTNLKDLETAAKWLEQHFDAPAILIGHSLGGAAVLSAAATIEGVKAVATIGAPAEPGHVLHLLGDSIGEIRESGAAKVNLAGRPFVVGKRFLDDIDAYNHEEVLKKLRGTDVLIMHSPKDQTVSIDNAGTIFTMLVHPKSFISLGEADHLLTRKTDADYVARLIATWASRSIG